MRSLLALLALVLVVAAFAAPARAGCQLFPGYSGAVALRWDACYGNGGLASKTFACDSNVGTDVLVASYVLDADMPMVAGMNVYIDLTSSSGAWPNWWGYESGACRPSSSGSLRASTQSDPAWTACPNYWDAGAAGGLTFNPGYGGTGTRELKIVEAVPPGTEFTAPGGSEIFALQIRINHAKTVGPTSCSGCEVPVCIALSEIDLVSTTVPDRVLCGPAFGSDSHLVTWQPASISNVDTHPIPGFETFHWATTTLTCSNATATRRSTWGSIKAIYR